MSTFKAYCERCGKVFTDSDPQQAQTDAEQCDHRMRSALHPKMTPCHSPITKANFCTCGTRCIWSPVIPRG
jgi:hypothetical protein